MFNFNRISADGKVFIEKLLSSKCNLTFGSICLLFPGTWRSLLPEHEIRLIQMTVGQPRIHQHLHNN